MGRLVPLKELRSAAGRLEAGLLEELAREEMTLHEFSADFHRKMEPVLARARHQERLRRRMQMAAASFAVIVLLAFSWLASSAEARAAVQKWVREAWQNGIVYRFFGAEHDGLPTYRPSWLPEGYQEADRYETMDYCVVTYRNDRGGCFFFGYQLMKDGSDMGLVFLDEEAYRQETVSIKGNPGEFYICTGGDEQSSLTWMDEDAGVAFTIDARLSDSVMLHIAESVSPVKTPK